MSTLKFIFVSHFNEIVVRYEIPCRGTTACDSGLKLISGPDSNLVFGIIVKSNVDFALYNISVISWKFVEAFEER